MKKLLPLLLVIVMVAPFGGVYFGFRFEKSRISKLVKRQMIKGIDKENLVLLTFHYTEVETRLRWEHSGEFEFEGEMYDVVERSSRNDSVSFWCWCDKAETSLNKKHAILLRQVLGNDPQKPVKQSQLLDYLKTLYHPGLNSGNLFSYAPEFHNLSFYYISLISAGNTQPPGPPPKII